MKENKKTLIGVICFAVLLIAALVIFIIVKPKASNTGKASITFTIDFGDGKTKEYKIKTDAQYLSGALLDEKLISGNQSDYGLYVTTVGGVTADESKQQWWCLYVGDEMAMYGVDQLPVEDGKSYKFTLVTGW